MPQIMNIEQNVANVFVSHLFSLVIIGNTIQFGVPFLRDYSGAASAADISQLFYRTIPQLML